MALAFAPSAVRLPEDLLYAIIGKASSLGELHQWALVHSTLLPVVGPALYKHVIIDSAGYLIPFLERLRLARDVAFDPATCGSLLLPFFRRIVKLEILAWARLGPVLDFCESRIGPPIPSTIELIVREVPIGGLKPWLCPILGEIHPVRVENVMVGAVLDRSRFLFPIFDAALAALMLAEYPRGRCVFAQTGGLPEERNAKAVWSSYDQVSDMQDTKLAWVQLDRPFFDCLAEWTAEHLPDDPWTANWHALVASADPFLDPAHPQPHQWSSVQEMVTWREDFLRQFQPFDDGQEKYEALRGAEEDRNLERQRIQRGFHDLPFDDSDA